MKSKSITRNRMSKSDFIKMYGSFCVFAILLLFNMIFTQNFMKLSTFINLGMQAFSVILVSIGMAVVIGAGGIDISVGATMAVSSVVCCLLIEKNAPTVLAILAALAVAVVIGLFNGAMITVFNIQPIIVTLIFYIAGRGIAQVLNDGKIISFYDNGFTDIGLFKIAGIPIQVFIALILSAVMIFVVKNTRFGFNVQAIGENARASTLVGINTRWTLMMTYVLIAVLAGIASVIDTSRIGSADPNSIGSEIEISAIAAVAIGGTSLSGGKIYLVGAVIGALVMQLITVTINMNNIPHAYSLVVKAAVVLAAVYLQRDKANR